MVVMDAGLRAPKSWRRYCMVRPESMMSSTMTTWRPVILLSRSLMRRTTPVDCAETAKTETLQKLRADAQRQADALASEIAVLEQGQTELSEQGSALAERIASLRMDAASRQAEQRGKTASCSVNMPQAVIQFSFTDAGASDITIQQANEAEAPDTPA